MPLIRFFPLPSPKIGWKSYQIICRPEHAGRHSNHSESSSLGAKWGSAQLEKKDSQMQTRMYAIVPRKDNLDTWVSLHPIPPAMLKLRVPLYVCTPVLIARVPNKYLH
jgi:hypothetical protein